MSRLYIWSIYLSIFLLFFLLSVFVQKIYHLAITHGSTEINRDIVIMLVTMKTILKAVISYSQFTVKA